jgi:hypothetical protein
MPTFPFRGQDVEITTSLDDLDLDAAELIEEELGLDLRDMGKLPKIRLMKTLALISVRRAFPDATMAEVGRIRLGALATAIADSAGATVPTNPRGIDFTGTVELGVAATDAAPADGGEVLSPTSAGSAPSVPPATA